MHQMYSCTTAECCNEQPELVPIHLVLQNCVKMATADAADTLLLGAGGGGKGNPTKKQPAASQPSRHINRVWNSMNCLSCTANKRCTGQCLLQVHRLYCHTDHQLQPGSALTVLQEQSCSCRFKSEILCCEQPQQLVRL